MEVERIMTSDPACCTPDTPLQEVARLMVENDCGQIPVVDDQNSMRTVGVITDRDIVCRALARGDNPLTLTAEHVMTRPVLTVRPSTKVEECCRLMEERQVRRAPVEDERGRCCGIVSIADIAQNLSEETTGEVMRTVSQPGSSSSGTGRSLAL
ncbi:MAG TPA: CBS domain-containing protein [Candidatus Eisenbacteria bacterium]|jgi:CBS domain-containing protein|nr:CBS domain-containing protein [Candidatus Eisenbacteria bacterium]